MIRPSPTNINTKRDTSNLDNIIAVNITQIAQIDAQ